jgi:hypothetical protein
LSAPASLTAEDLEAQLLAARAAIDILLTDLYGDAFDSGVVL